jgi:pantothenate kinase, type III
VIKLILGFDIGNTHIVPIFYSNEGEILASFRIPTNLTYTEDTFFAVLKTLSENSKIDIYKTQSIIVSSVVPHINEIFYYLGKKYFKLTPKFISLKNTKKEIIFSENFERGLGADRICDILALKKTYKKNEFVVIDFGTATTFDVIKDSVYCGGCILPGITLSINALFTNTAKLPKVSFENSNSALGTNTTEQINAGIFFGNVGAIKELIFQYKKDFPNACVIATGGQGKKISEYVETIDEYIENLGAKGIFEFYKLNKN